MEDKKTEKIKDDNLYLSFVEISKNLNLGQLKKILLELSLRELIMQSTKGTLPVLYVTYQYYDLFWVNTPQLRL